MAMVPVLISVVGGKAVATPDTALVDPGDTVVWAHEPGKHWPPGFSANMVIRYLNGTHLIDISTLQFIPQTGSPRVISATIISNAKPGQEEDYDASIPSLENEDVILCTHLQGYGSFDPKIKVKG